MAATPTDDDRDDRLTTLVVRTGTPGNDELNGTGADDTLSGAAGDDVLRGGAGRDQLNGNAGADQLFGNGGPDLLRGGGGPDQLAGGRGSDRLDGNNGDDVLRGGGGIDLLIGGPGADTLIGGGGTDRFLMNAVDGQADRIRDFNPNQNDTVDVTELVNQASAPFVIQSDVPEGKLIQVDQDGAGGAAPIDVAIVEGATLDLTETQLGFPDSIPGNAATTRTLEVGGAAFSEIAPAADTDWFKVDLTAGGSYLFRMEGAETDKGSLGDPVLAVFNPSANFQVLDDNGGIGLNAEVFFTPANDGTFFLAAAAGQGQSGSYEVNATQLGPDLPAGTGTTATVPVGSAVVNQIETPGDVDWFQVELEAGQSYRFVAAGSSTGAGSLRDPVLGLFNPNGIELNADDDSGPGFNAVIQNFVPGQSNTFFLAVRSTEDEGVGTYKIRALVNEPAPAQVASADSLTPSEILDDTPAGGLGSSSPGPAAEAPSIDLAALIGSPGGEAVLPTEV